MTDVPQAQIVIVFQLVAGFETYLDAVGDAWPRTGSVPSSIELLCASKFGDDAKTGFLTAESNAG